MRLISIKLAGFKSFVDPTSFAVPGQRVGVVGPNGCGKSNIIDAVRWVLGESRASELRGESMQDVIFNGSTQRKPASRASVELIFDNTAGRAAGQWSQYAEIAVKRILTRDGTSSYYINNLSVRRRDIQGIFLGTGLGPRAYAIIGQGMIARIIEAKPDELRVFLEEAAGVSKYKERRRETANRLHDTREHLTRVEDILRELNCQLDKLEAQATIAQRYQILKAENEEKQLLLWLLRKNEAQAEKALQQSALANAQVELEEQTAKLREIEAQLEILKEAYATASDTLQAEQGAMYEINAQINQLETQIRFITETRHRIQTQISNLNTQREQWLAQAAQARAEYVNAEQTLAIATEKSAQAEHAARSQNTVLPALETRWREAQAQLTHGHSQIAQLEQACKLETAQQHNAQQQLQQWQQRRERLHHEIRSLAMPDPAQLEAARLQRAEQDENLQHQQQHLNQAQQAALQSEQVLRLAQQQWQAESTVLQQLEAQLNALKQLQHSIQANDALQPWLEQHDFAAAPHLWQKLHIEPGWETALEAVLRERLAALEISDLAQTATLVAEAPPAKLAFFAPPPASYAVMPATGLRPLLAFLRINDPSLRAVLADWLAGVFIANNLAQALAERAQLPVGSVFVVPAGHQISRVGVQFYAADSEQAGLLARAQEIENLDKQVRAQSLLTEDFKTTATRTAAAWHQANQTLTEARAQIEHIIQRGHALQLEALKLTQAEERYTARSTQINEELSEVIAHIETQHEHLAQAEDNFKQAHQALLAAQANLSDDQHRFSTLEQELTQARQQAREHERNAQEAHYAVRAATTRIDELKRLIQAAQEQAEQHLKTLHQTQAELEATHSQTLQESLEEALNARVAKEHSLSAARTELDMLGVQLRMTDEARLTAERTLQPLREQITGLQLKVQAAQMNQTQFDEQLVSADANQAELATKLPAQLKPSALQSELTRLNQAIQALGPVNMAALDECATARERKQFLDAQSTDLNSAIDTLETAIRKIDQETRQLLQNTFDEVNRHFGELFPRLFGGGQAKLLMTGDEILDAGVQVMAQPPGKKNSTIHLLSGGEKALTATALVFALFQLNPAPFCLLDEVDAPLDDANTERFVNLVRTMSDHTQFLFISHNKIAMEMAQQLIGVTMQEQGVSRIVAVDMEAAENFVAAA
ncbi:chromosome segregation protein SMC [Mycoavidus sp. B2-EB]|uniref:chromosome segregation protein SMC n=1 Tax=Mycoavidus sp. B2-EB TaxID=2651972 RepID=UPI001627F3A7|nr:chromosome segregation protein SMC [Mycoavidus sp. B2-EB]BBO59778.1 chromosome partition protein Smc [Mycoavidus sp. B2-EB]